MERTLFAGLTRLDIAEALSSDNFSFQHLNPATIDYLLRLGAKSHKHDAHPGIANPTITPTIAVITSTPGTIPADTGLFVGYTLLDAQGGETELVQPPATTTTPSGLAAPTTGPTLALDTTAGTLLSGDRQYGITVTDGAGGETVIGPLVPVTVPPGYPNAQVLISGLSGILTATAPDIPTAHWRLYVSVDGQDFQFLNEGATDTFTDDGSVPVQCLNPPTSPTASSAYSVEITVPGGQDASAVSANVYLSVDGSFDAPCLLANILAANFGTTYTYSALSFQSEQPPPVNLSIGGADKIDPDNDMLDFPWKRPVATAGDLPSGGNTIGDIREAIDTRILYVWDGSVWQEQNASAGGFSWHAAWSNIVAYTPGDAVERNGSSFIAVLGNTNVDPATDVDMSTGLGTGWNLLAKEGATGSAGAAGAPGLNWRGAWSSATAYGIDDGVLRGGSSYICKVGNTNVDPASDVDPVTGIGTDWDLLASVGAAGTGGGSPTLYGASGNSLGLPAWPPSSPTDGLEAQYLADDTNGVVWTFRYRSGSSSSYKWEFVGGSNLYGEVVTDQSTSSTSFTDLSTVGPSVTLPMAGDFEIGWGMHCWPEASSGNVQGGQMGLSVNGSIASDDYIEVSGYMTTSSPSLSTARVRRKTGLTSGWVVKGQYKTDGAGNLHFGERFLTVRPIRVS